MVQRAETGRGSHCGGVCFIDGNPSLETLEDSFQRLEEVEGQLSFHSMPALHTITPFSALRKVHGTLSLGNTAGAWDTSHFPNLECVGSVQQDDRFSTVGAELLARGVRSPC